MKIEISEKEVIRLLYEFVRPDEDEQYQLNEILYSISDKLEDIKRFIREVKDNYDDYGDYYPSYRDSDCCDEAPVLNLSSEYCADLPFSDVDMEV